MTEWREQKLSDFMDFNPYTPLSKGIIAKKVTMEKLIPFNRKIQGYEDAVFSGGTKFKNGDTLVARITPCLENGKTAYVDFLNDEEVAFGSTEFIVLRAKEGISDSRFIFYFAISDEFRDTAIQLMSGTSGRQRVDTEALKRKVFTLPPLPEQKAIAEVLSSLDDKIDLLTKQNKTLEDLAQAYFRKWFIEDASKEWEVVPISEKFDVLLGGTPSRKIESYWTNGTIGWINSGKINEFRIIEASEYITEEALNNSSAKLLPAGTTVLAITGATLGKISMVLRSFAANQSVIGLVPKAELSNNFIFLWLKENINALISMQTGGAQQHINSNDVKSFDVIVPDTVALSLFRRKIDPLMLKISQNCFQINTLNKLRDTLLPKLISGEIRVKM
ncbi:restriction endonuclease subunit S [Acetivibrio clariflavus]|uniref:restriction endonuclease subunit S n=1 Tax=Acetivibrio clariflavus TaxID=288965 RepID=UPI000482EF5D|nr:restriction endonuclease subunit S [Acetivibrio clariflavus]